MKRASSPGVLGGEVGGNGGVYGQSVDAEGEGGMRRDWRAEPGVSYAESCRLRLLNIWYSFKLL